MFSSSEFKKEADRVLLSRTGDASLVQEVQEVQEVQDIESRFINNIMAAANVYEVQYGSVVERLVLVDNCHMGRNMQSITKVLRSLGAEVRLCNELPDRGQGFIDECGTYHNRSDAYVIAKSSSQPFNDEYTLPGNRLDSSCIRHFSSTKTFNDYIPTNIK